MQISPDAVDTIASKLACLAAQLKPPAAACHRLDSDEIAEFLDAVVVELTGLRSKPNVDPNLQPPTAPIVSGSEINEMAGDLTAAEVELRRIMANGWKSASILDALTRIVRVAARFDTLRSEGAFAPLPEPSIPDDGGDEPEDDYEDPLDVLERAIAGTVVHALHAGDLNADAAHDAVSILDRLRESRRLEDMVRAEQFAPDDDEDDLIIQVGRPFVESASDAEIAAVIRDARAHLRI